MWYETQNIMTKTSQKLILNKQPIKTRSTAGYVVDTKGIGLKYPELNFYKMQCKQRSILF